MSKQYNYKNCQSLFGYAFDVHVRSSGTCKLCGCGGDNLTFDLWRQMTIEHIIGRKQGGSLKEIREAVAKRFTDLNASEQDKLCNEINEINTVTACSFCNSVTSRHPIDTNMQDLICDQTLGQNEICKKIKSEVEKILESKKADIKWKLESIRKEYKAIFLAKISNAGNK